MPAAFAARDSHRRRICARARAPPSRRSSIWFNVTASAEISSRVSGIGRRLPGVVALIRLARRRIASTGRSAAAARRIPRRLQAAAPPAPRTKTHARDDAASPHAPLPTGRSPARHADRQRLRAQRPTAIRRGGRRSSSCVAADDPRSPARAIRHAAVSARSPAASRQSSLRPARPARSSGRRSHPGRAGAGLARVGDGPVGLGVQVLIDRGQERAATRR